MSKKIKTDFKSRAAAIFKGHKVGAEGVFVQDLTTDEGKLALVFLSFIKYIGLDIFPIDESKLKTADTLRYLAQTQKVYASKEDLDPFWYDKDMGDFIGFEKAGGLPVIMERGLLGYSALSPYNKTRLRISAKNAAEYEEKGIIIYPIYDRQENFKKFGWVLKTLKSMHRDVVTVYAMTLLTSLLGMIVPMATGRITGRISLIENKNSLLVFGIALLLPIIATCLVNIVINTARARIETRAGLNAVNHLRYKLLLMPSAYEKKYANKMVSGNMRILVAIGQTIGALVSSVVYIVQCLIILLVIRGINGGITVPLFRFVFADICVCAFILHRLKQAKQKENETNLNFTSFRKELLDNMQAIKNNGVEDRMYYRSAVQFDEYARQTRRAENLTQWMGILNSMLGGLGILLICLSAYSLSYNRLGVVTALISLFTLLLGYIPQAINCLMTIIGNIPCLALTDIITSAPEERTESSGIDVEINGNIELRDVSFSYSANSVPVIKDLSLKIKSGEYIGIVGESGCGKSTLIRLLLGFETAQQGEIRYDGISIDKFAMHSLRSQFGVVLQDAGIISGSIRTNIGISEDADMEKVEQAAKVAAIYDEIEAMPMKFNTFLSGNSNLISGGQKQRILLARALMNNPKILIMDEATSALDNISQRKVKENLDALGITRIAVAHRLSTVRDCDRIIVLDKGVIAEEGSFDELMQLGGKFAKMAERNL